MKSKNIIHAKYIGECVKRLSGDSYNLNNSDFDKLSSEEKSAAKTIATKIANNEWD